MEITSDIHWIQGVNGNCYIIVDNEELTLIDTGMPRNSKKILDYIQNELHREPASLKRIILTHFHIDHVGNAEELQKITGAKISAHAEDIDYIEGKKAPPKPKGGLRILVVLLAPLFKAKPFKVDVVLNEGDNINGFKVLHVPGHTPGSIALYDPSRKVLFVGDLLRYRKGKVQGPPNTIDAALVRKSIETIKSLDFDIMLSGHGDPLKPGASARVREFTIA